MYHTLLNKYACTSASHILKKHPELILHKGKIIGKYESNKNKQKIAEDVLEKRAWGMGWGYPHDNMGNEIVNKEDASVQASVRNYILQKQAASYNQRFSPEKPMQDLTAKKIVRSGRIFRKLMRIE